MVDPKRQTFLTSSPEIEFIEVPLKYQYREALLTHYAGSKSIIGRRLYYSIVRNGVEIGVIGVQSSTMPIKRVVDLVYGKLPSKAYGLNRNPDGTVKCDKALKGRYAVEVINNNIFRLYVREPNLASHVLKLFRQKVPDAFYAKYKQRVKAIISLSFGVTDTGDIRSGKCYRADNWIYIGLSSGAKKVLDGSMHKFHVEKVEKKNIWLWVYNRHKRVSV